METIVIVGGGAGGLELATRLGDTMGAGKRARILLVDRSPGHFWKPLLHTVASGKCDPQVTELAFTAQALDHDFEFLQGEVLCVDSAHQTITLTPRGGRQDDGVCRTIGYDKLVLALGADAAVDEAAAERFGVGHAVEGHRVPGRAGDAVEVGDRAQGQH